MLSDDANNELTTILAKLIAFDTTSHRSNMALMDYVQSYLQDYGVRSELVRDPVQPKANLFATIGPDCAGGIVLSGHTDTVPVTGQHWQTDPFQLTPKQDRFYGRGTADMKGFLACVLASVPDMVKADLKTPIHLAFSYDEEIGCLGVRHLIEHLKQHPHRAAACIIGEPTNMDVATAHKGKVGLEVTVTGKACHSGMAPEGVNAINYAARLVNWLADLADEKQQQGPFQPIYSPPFTTVHTGVIHGGEALNIVPDKCTFKFEIRHIADEDPAPLLERFNDYVAQQRQAMQQHFAECDIQVKTTASYPGLQTPENTQLVTLIRELAQSQQASTTINFGTEGGLFNDHLHLTTVVCGPGSMQQGHKPDEYVEASQLNQCMGFLQRLVAHMSAHNAA